MGERQHVAGGWWVGSISVHGVGRKGNTVTIMKTEDIIKYALIAAGAYLVWEYVISPMLATTPAPAPATGTGATTTTAAAPANTTQSTTTTTNPVVMTNSTPPSITAPAPTGGGMLFAATLNAA